MAALSALAEERPVFHSEADFQFALAWAIRERCGFRVRLEHPVPLPDEVGYVDIWTLASQSAAPVELKYWTRKHEIVTHGERYSLRDQGAQDLSRYDLWKDVARLERIIDEGAAPAGYMVALTNDRTYWNAGRSGTIDAAFRIHEGRQVSESLTWSRRAAAGTTRGRESAIELRGRYVSRWAHYSQATEGLGGEFRYLLLDVGAALKAATSCASP